MPNRVRTDDDTDTHTELKRLVCCIPRSALNDTEAAIVVSILRAVELRIDAESKPSVSVPRLRLVH